MRRAVARPKHANNIIQLSLLCERDLKMISVRARRSLSFAKRHRSGKSERAVSRANKTRDEGTPWGAAPEPSQPNGGRGGQGERGERGGARGRSLRAQTAPRIFARRRPLRGLRRLS